MSTLIESFISTKYDTIRTEANNNDELDLSVLIDWKDYLAIGLYFVVIMIVGLWSSKTANQKTVDGYFLAGRNMHWLLVGASIFSSNIGSEHYIGLAGSGASSGIGIAAFEYVAMYTLLVLGWYFMPVYMASNVSTMPEYLKKRFGGQRIRIYLSVLALILYIFTKISASLYAGAVFIRLLLKIDNILVGCIILIIVSALFTIVGGLTAVIWTDSIQTLLMMAGAIYLSITSITKVGGYEYLVENFREKGLPNGTEYQSYVDGCNASVPNNTCVSCSTITPHYLNMIRPIDDQEIPWLGIFGIFVSCIWYWCTDQVIVQRALSAKNLTHAKTGCIVASLLKILPLYLLVLPGMAARVLWPNQIGCSNPEYCKKVCGSQSGCTNFAYPFLVIKLMPRGATGLMFSAILAALMSSLTSIFNSASTIFIIDIYLRFRKKANETEQIIVSRIFVVILVVISVIWVPILESSKNSQLFPYIQSVTSYLSPPLCAVYVLSIFWDRTTEAGAFWSLIIGLIIGMTRFILEFAIPAPVCGTTDEDRRPSIVSKVHYLHFGVLLFVISMIVAIVISLMTEKIDPKYLHRLTYSTRHSEEVRKERDEENDENGDSNNAGNNRRFSSQKSAKSQGQDESSIIRKYLMLICCASGWENSATTSEDNNVLNNGAIDMPEIEAKLHAQAAQDDPKYSQITNLLAVFVIVVVSFLFGFYH